MPRHTDNTWLERIAGYLSGNLGTYLKVQQKQPSTGVQTSVASSASSVTILAANSNRFGASLYNDSTQILYLLYSNGTASNTNYSLQIPAGAYWELPFSYTGAITGIWASANGNARVTELTT